MKTTIFLFIALACILIAGCEKTIEEPVITQYPPVVSTPCGIGDLNSVIYANGIFVAVGDGYVDTSTNWGYNEVMTLYDHNFYWTDRPTSGVDGLSQIGRHNWQSISYSKELKLFVAVASTGIHKIMISPDGLTWIARNFPVGDGNTELYSVACGNGIIIAIGNGGKYHLDETRVMMSKDAINWTVQMTLATQCLHISFENGLFFMYGSSVMMSSVNGEIWTSALIPQGVWNLSSITYGNGLYIATNNNSSTGGALKSSNGLTWTTASLESGYWTSSTYSNGLFIVISNDKMVSSSDGIIWKVQTIPEGNWKSVASNGKEIVAVGAGGQKVSFVLE